MRTVIKRKYENYSPPFDDSDHVALEKLIKSYYEQTELDAIPSAPGPVTLKAANLRPEEVVVSVNSTSTVVSVSQPFQTRIYSPKLKFTCSSRLVAVMLILILIMFCSSFLVWLFYSNSGTTLRAQFKAKQLLHEEIVEAYNVLDVESQSTGLEEYLRRKLKSYYVLVSVHYSEKYQAFQIDLSYSKSTRSFFVSVVFFRYSDSGAFYFATSLLKTLDLGIIDPGFVCPEDIQSIGSLVELLIEPKLSIFELSLTGQYTLISMDVDTFMINTNFVLNRPDNYHSVPSISLVFAHCVQRKMITHDQEIIITSLGLNSIVVDYRDNHTETEGKLIEFLRLVTGSADLKLFTTYYDVFTVELSIEPVTVFFDIVPTFELSVHGTFLFDAFNVLSSVELPVLEVDDTLNVTSLELSLKSWIQCELLYTFSGDVRRHYSCFTVVLSFSVPNIHKQLDLCPQFELSQKGLFMFSVQEHIKSSSFCVELESFHISASYYINDLTTAVQSFCQPLNVDAEVYHLEHEFFRIFLFFQDAVQSFVLNFFPLEHFTCHQTRVVENLKHLVLLFFTENTIVVNRFDDELNSEQLQAVISNLLGSFQGGFSLLKDNNFWHVTIFIYPVSTTFSFLPTFVLSQCGVEVDDAISALSQAVLPVFSVDDLNDVLLCEEVVEEWVKFELVPHFNGTIKVTRHGSATYDVCFSCGMVQSCVPISPEFTLSAAVLTLNEVKRRILSPDLTMSSISCPSEVSHYLSDLQNQVETIASNFNVTSIVSFDSSRGNFEIVLQLGHLTKLFYYDLDLSQHFRFYNEFCGDNEERGVFVSKAKWKRPANLHVKHKLEAVSLFAKNTVGNDLISNIKHLKTLETINDWALCTSNDEFSVSVDDGTFVRTVSFVMSLEAKATHIFMFWVWVFSGIHSLLPHLLFQLQCH
ncbi:hypothetical protein RCL1_002582 [Eukaryota sp. TZLM3-RCL]